MSSGFTKEEEDHLIQGGLNLEPHDGDPLQQSKDEYARLVADALSAEELAEAHLLTVEQLNRNVERFRDLYAIKVDGKYKFPEFQFAPGYVRLIRNIRQVIPKINRDAHPLEVESWFTSPHPDLVIGEDEHPISPIEWLEQKRDYEIVAKLAEEI